MVVHLAVALLVILVGFGVGVLIGQLSHPPRASGSSARPEPSLPPMATRPAPGA